jgi:hypothetical protein
VGVACALFVNWYFTRARVEQLMTRLHIPHHPDGSVNLGRSDKNEQDAA